GAFDETLFANVELDDNTDNGDGVKDCGDDEEKEFFDAPSDADDEDESFFDAIDDRMTATTSTLGFYSNLGIGIGEGFQVANIGLALTTNAELGLNHNNYNSTIHGSLSSELELSLSRWDRFRLATRSGLRTELYNFGYQTSAFSEAEISGELRARLVQRFASNFRFQSNILVNNEELTNIVSFLGYHAAAGMRARLLMLWDSTPENPHRARVISSILTGAQFIGGMLGWTAGLFCSAPASGLTLGTAAATTATSALLAAMPFRYFRPNHYVFPTTPDFYLPNVEMNRTTFYSTGMFWRAQMRTGAAISRVPALRRFNFSYQQTPANHFDPGPANRLARIDGTYPDLADDEVHRRDWPAPLDFGFDAENDDYQVHSPPNAPSVGLDELVQRLRLGYGVPGFRLDPHAPEHIPVHQRALNLQAEEEQGAAGEADEESLQPIVARHFTLSAAQRAFWNNCQLFFNRDAVESVDQDLDYLRVR
ncbi:MAG: hypothetical protein ACRC1U_10055, partial [Vibrionaceae bacterium]